MNLNGLINFLESLKFKQNTTSPGLCCLSVSPKKIALAYSIPDEVQKTAQLQTLDILHYENSKNLPVVLKDLVNKHNLEGVSCSYILQPQDYQILTIEALPVSGEELHSALRWRIKELIDYPVESAVFDSFPVPSIGSGERKMMFVVASRLTRLNEIVDEVTNCGLNVQIIDIPELALRNLSALYESDGSSTAIILLHPQDSQLIITKNQALYMSRRFGYNVSFSDENLSDLSENKLLERLILEIQRSLDYYQSQMRQMPPTRCLLSVATNENEKVASFIQERLGIKTQAINLNELLKFPTKLTVEQQVDGLIVAAGSLRIGESMNASAN